MGSIDRGRRRFLIRAVMVGASLAGLSGAARPDARRLGIALGGGGAKGLAHVPMLEVLDELGIRPHRVAGASIGAVIGGLYCSGMSGRAIRELVDGLIVDPGEAWSRALFDQEVLRLWDFFDSGAGAGGLVEPQSFIDFLRKRMGASRFDELEIPLSVVATALRSRGPRVMTSGDLLCAIKASMAVPGLFPPVERDGELLVDGGLVDPVPYGLLFEDCDLVVAVDVIGERSERSPSALESVFDAFLIQQAALTREKLLHRRPDVYLRPDIRGIRMLEFFRAEEIYAQTAAAREELRSALEQALRPAG